MKTTRHRVIRGKNDTLIIFIAGLEKRGFIIRKIINPDFRFLKIIKIFIAAKKIKI